MPVFQSGRGLAPKWCEMEYFEIVAVPVGGTHLFDRIGRREKIIVGKGKAIVADAGRESTAVEGSAFEIDSPTASFEVLEVREPLMLVRMCGYWKDPTGGSGLFKVSTSDTPRDAGDKVDYIKSTNFDSHYHDCDEYWIIFEGSGIAFSEGRHYELRPGDCVATGIGHHHDFPIVREPVHAVYFETTLEGQKRLGHLWNHTHGEPSPKWERM